jgi:glycolate oxidase
MVKEEWEEKHSKAAGEIYRQALSMGGMITGEHGIGITRKDFLPLAVDEEQITIMKKIKEAFDPNHILNPGKIF